MLNSIIDSPNSVINLWDYELVLYERGKYDLLIVCHKLLSDFRMKKISLLLLTAMYAISTFGIGVNVFYCCGKPKSFNISFIHSVKDDLVKKAGESKNCCQTAHQYFKVKDNHKAADNLVSFSFSFNQLSGVIPVIATPVTSVGKLIAANGTHAPPLLRTVPIYLSNCVFRI